MEKPRISVQTFAKATATPSEHSRNTILTVYLSLRQFSINVKS